MKRISDILTSSFMPLEERVIHQIHKFEKRKWLPVAQHILLNQPCRIQEDFLEKVMAMPKKSKMGASGSRSGEIQFRAEETACGNPCRQKETWPFG